MGTNFVWRFWRVGWVIGDGIAANFCSTSNSAGRWVSIFGTRLFVLVKKVK